ncbi:serine/threonine-protein kinase pakE-like protein [Tanacetum coccineum]
MSPDRDTLLASYNNNAKCNHQKPSRLSMDTLQRTISDISFELSKEVDDVVADHLSLPTISEVEDAKCECCGMSEECTPEYVARVREKFLGKLICGLCSEAVKEEMEKSGGNIEEALSEHTSVCVRFNRFDRTNPVLFQAAAMKEMLKKSTRVDGNRAKSLSPRDQKRGYGNAIKKGGLTRSSSCIPSITREISDRKVFN